MRVSNGLLHGYKAHTYILTALHEPVREIRKHNCPEIVGGSVATEYELRYQLLTRSSIQLM